MAGKSFLWSEALRRPLRMRVFRLLRMRRRLWVYLAAAGLSAGVLGLVIPALSSSRQSSSAPEESPLVIENRLPGTDEWRLTKVADDVDQQIKGYASATSVNIGQRIDFFVTVHPVQGYSIDIYRFGYYQGRGGRLVEHRDGLSG